MRQTAGIVISLCFMLQGFVAEAGATMRPNAQNEKLNPMFQMAMAKPLPRKQPEDDTPASPIAMKRYIVTHNCPESSPSEITQSLAGMDFALKDKMQFTPQFVIEASDEAYAKLKGQPCVKSIQEDLPVGLATP